MPRCGSKMQSFLAWASPSDAITEGILGTPGLISNSPHAADTSCLCTKTTPLSLGPTPSPRRWKEVPTEIPAGCSSPQKASVARRGAATAATAVCDAFLHRELLLLDTDRLSLSRNRITDARATFESRRKTLLQSETIPGSPDRIDGSL